MAAEGLVTAVEVTIKMAEKSVLDRISDDTKDDFNSIKWVGNFWDFEKMLQADPQKHLRTAYQYVNDMINFFGTLKYEDCGEELTRYKIFDDPFNKGKHAIFGLDRVLMELVANIKTIAETGGEERILLLHGPVATSKTSIANLLIEGCEEYSMTDSGMLFSFSWIFSNKQASTVGFQLPHHKRKKKHESYADLPPNQVIADIPCQINDSPILLIPKKYRKAYLDEMLGNVGQKFNVPKKLLEGELCYNCQSLYNSLLQKYNGDFEKVLKHIRIERLLVSQVNQKGAATVQPVDNAEGSSPVITWEGREYAHLEKLIRGIKLHKFMGKWADSNRGLIHFTDIFKKNSFFLQYLLSASQEHLVDFSGVQGDVDVMIIGTTNKSEYKRFKENPDNAALNDRIRKTDIVYLSDAKSEGKIYKKQLEEANYADDKKEGNGHISPHWVDMLALWAVLTRIEKPRDEDFGDKEVTEEKVKAIANLTAYQKAKLYNGEKVPGLSRQEELILKDKYTQKLIRREYPLEGDEGVSPRIIQNMLIDILTVEQKNPTKCLRIFNLFNSLEKLVESDFDFLKVQPVEGGYYNPKFAITTIMHEYYETVIKECKWSIIGLKKEDIEKKVREYVSHVKAYANKEVLVNPITGKDEKPNEEKMKWVEERLGVKAGDKEDFRKEILREAAYNQIDNPGMEFDFNEAYSYLYEELERGLFEEKKNNLPISFEQAKYALSKYGTDKFGKLDQLHQKAVTDMVNAMVKDYKYCPHCAKDTLLCSIEFEFENPIELVEPRIITPSYSKQKDENAERLEKLKDLYSQLIKTGGILP